MNISSSTNIQPKAFILAAGLGTRLKPWTDYHPKALALVHGKTLLQRNIEYLQRYNIYDVVVNVHHFSDQIIEAIQKNNGWGSTVTISNESECVLETGGGLMKAESLLKESNPIVMMNVDVLTDSDLGSMLQYHVNKKPLATLATSNRISKRYLLFNNDNTFCGWRNDETGEERKNPNVLEALFPKAFSGIHIIDPTIFNYINRTGKFSIIDAYLDLMLSYTIQSFEFAEAKFIDVGKPGSIEKAEALFL